MTLSEKIKLLRRRSGLTQEQLAERIGVTRQALSKWETDNAIPDSATTAQLARLLSVATGSLPLDALDPTSPPPAPAAPMPPVHMSIAAVGDRTPRSPTTVFPHFCAIIT